MPICTSHPTRGGWIEICRYFVPVDQHWSHPTRGGWIEIIPFFLSRFKDNVPPHTGWVD